MSDRENYLSDLKKDLTTYGQELTKLKDDLKHKAGPEFENALKAAQESYKHAEKAYESLKAAAGEEWEDLKDSTHKAFDNLAHSLKGLGISGLGNFSQLQERYKEELKEQIKNNPLTCVFTALGIGFILGKLMK